MLFFLCFFIGKMQAQFCGTPELTETEFKALPYYGNNAYLQNLVDSLMTIFNNPANRVEGKEEGVWYRVPIQFWIYTWNGQNSLRRPENEIDKRLKAMIWHLNSAMQRNQVPIRFYALCPRYVEERSPTVGELDFEGKMNVGSNHQTPKALNCHLINRIANNDPEKITFGEWFYPNNAVFVVGNAITEKISDFGEILPQNSGGNATFVHEVGHWLGLQHTHQFDGVPCLKEPVSRGIFFSICADTPIRHCDIRGDGLCDTPADPNLGEHYGDLDVNCGWKVRLKDDRGDFYVPDTKNYMSYGDATCASIFTPQQKAVMLRGLLLQQIKLGANFVITSATNFDIYEPDNVPAMATLIRPDETKIHSFSEIGSCVDDADWVKFNYPQSQVALEDMYLELENVDGYNNPVLEIEFWNGGNGFAIAPEPVDRENYRQIVTTPTKITYIIPCTITAGRTYLFKVVRNGNQTGRYKLTFKKKPTPQAFGNRFLCLGIPQTYTLTNVPASANITWTFSRNLTVISGQGTSQITVMANSAGNGFITPFIFGCGNTLQLPQINLIMGITQVYPVTFTATPIVGQAITFTIQKPEPLNVDAYTYQLFVNPQSTNQFYNWSLLSYVDTGTHIEMYVRVGLGSAEIGMEVNSCNQIVASPNIYVEGIPDPNCYYSLRVSPNPSKDFISIARISPEPCLALRTYQGKLYNKFNKVVWQGEIKEDVQIDARKLPNDVYFLHITDEKGNIQKQQIILNK